MPTAAAKKVKLHFRPVGSAPILKMLKFLRMVRAASDPHLSPRGRRPAHPRFPCPLVQIRFMKLIRLLKAAKIFKIIEEEMDIHTYIHTYMHEYMIGIVVNGYLPRYVDAFSIYR